MDGPSLAEVLGQFTMWLTWAKPYLVYMLGAMLAGIVVGALVRQFGGPGEE